MKFDIIKKMAVFLEGRPEIVAAYIFGSYAKGGEKMGSDIDLGILLDHDVVSQKNDLRRQYIVGLARILHKDIDIVIMNDAGQEIMAQILKYGRCIFNRSPHTLSCFRMVSNAMIAEFGYHRDLMKKGFIRRLLGESR